jgi:arylsulfatase A-like enzyme
MISLDTVRWDVELSSLSRLAGESVSFSRAYVPMPFTLPAHMSMMTGLYPESHYVILEGTSLPPTVPTLASALQSLGYRTWGIHTNDWLDEGFGFARGFDAYTMLAPGLTFADRVTRAAVERVDWRPSDGSPVFVFLHYMDAHSDSSGGEGNTLPYFAPPEDLDSLAERLEEWDFCDDQSRCATEFLLAADREGRHVPSEQIRLIEELYRQGTRFLDRHLGALFQWLRDQGLWDDLLVVVVSDHGQEFREHGMFLHSQPYEETIRVPLLLRLPGAAHGGITIDEPVAVVDLLPTILGHLRVAPPAAIHGRNLLELVARPAEAPPPILSQDKHDRRRFAIIQGDRKLIMNLATGEQELYDLARDPEERHEMSRADPETTRALARMLVQQIREARQLKRELFEEGSAPIGEHAFSPETRERLRSLGYLD